MDEAELAAGRVQVGEASILWHNEVDIEVDIEASEGPAVAAWSLLEASRPPVDLSELQACRNILFLMADRTYTRRLWWRSLIQASRV